MKNSLNDEHIQKLKRNIVAIGRLLWEKELVTGLNGNISARLDEHKLLLTATKTCLGLLHEEDILIVNLDGEILEPSENRGVSTERLLHTSVYRQFPDIDAVVHTHTVYTNAYFLENDSLDPRIFETRFFLGNVTAIDQTTPSVTDAGPVIEGFKKNNVVVLKNHGVVSIGKDLFDCFLYIQCLEEAVKVDAVSRLYRQVAKPKPKKKRPAAASPARKSGQKRYELFSPDQIKEIVRLVNADNTLKEMGEKTRMTMDLAVKLDETGDVFGFRFKNGRITEVTHDENAEFLISAPEKIWRQVFNHEIDPFVATTQKKMNLRGDFAKISQWYAPCSRIFELWQKVPVN